MSSSVTENIELIQAAKNGNERALTELINMYANPVHNFIYSVLHDSQIVEDLAQETFLRMILAIKNYEFRAPFKSWLFRIAVNLCRDHLRRKKVRKIVSFITNDFSNKDLEILDDQQDPLKELESKELNKNLRYAIDHLSESLKMVFIMRDIEELSYEEISASLNWNLGTVKSRLFRARKEISNYIKKSQENQNENFEYSFNQV